MANDDHADPAALRSSRLPADQIRLGGASKVIAAHWRLGLFGFYERIHGFPRSGLALSVRGLLSWAGVLAAAGYLAGAAAVTQWLQRDPYNRIGFADVVSWPWRREHVSRLRGEGLLA